MSKNSFPEFAIFLLFLIFMVVVSIRDGFWLITFACVYGFLGIILSIYYDY